MLKFGEERTYDSYYETVTPCPLHSAAHSWKISKKWTFSYPELFIDCDDAVILYDRAGIELQGMFQQDGNFTEAAVT